MTVFWHHVGDANSVRDFPKTIGSEKLGLRRFKVQDIQGHLSTLGPEQSQELTRNFSRIGSSEFQIWGIPSGAKGALKRVKTGDSLLLLNSTEEWGSFKYLGRILYRLPGEHWPLSYRLWGEQRFPLILLLQGGLLHYPWPRFVKDLRYGEGLKGMGRVHSIGRQALESSEFLTEEDFLMHVHDQHSQAVAATEL